MAITPYITYEWYDRYEHDPNDPTEYSDQVITTEPLW